MIVARFIEMNVFPSELIVEEIAITGFSLSRIKYFRLVLTDLNDSASVDPGLALTGMSDLY